MLDLTATRAVLWPAHIERRERPRPLIAAACAVRHPGNGETLSVESDDAKQLTTAGASGAGRRQSAGIALAVDTDWISLNSACRSPPPRGSRRNTAVTSPARPEPLCQCRASRRGRRSSFRRCPAAAGALALERPRSARRCVHENAGVALAHASDRTSFGGPALLPPQASSTNPRAASPSRRAPLGARPPRSPSAAPRSRCFGMSSRSER